MNTKHLFFDLDRTLWDFEKNSEIALKQLYDELGLKASIVDFEDFHARYKEHNSELWKLYGSGKMTKEVLRNERFKRALDDFGIDDPIVVQNISDGYVELSPKQTALFPNTLETLQYLQKEGFNMHIITNGFKEVQTIKLDRSGLEKFFDVIVCSEDVGKNKPNPDIFHYSLKKAGADPLSSVMIGDDHEVDIRGAANVGMNGVLFDPLNELEHTNEEWRIQSIDELPGILPWIFRTRF